MRIEFFCPMEKIPTVTAQEKGVDFKNKRFYTKPEVQKVKNQYIAMLMMHRPRRMLEGAIALNVSFRFPITRGKKEGQWKITKPDTDNMLKLLKDCGTACGYWQDDAQIAYEVVSKKYSENSGIVFVAEEMEADNDKVN